MVVQVADHTLSLKPLPNLRQCHRWTIYFSPNSIEVANNKPRLKSKYIFGQKGQDYEQRAQPSQTYQVPSLAEIACRTALPLLAFAARCCPTCSRNIPPLVHSVFGKTQHAYIWKLHSRSHLDFQPRNLRLISQVGCG